MAIHFTEERAVRPKAPEVMNPVTANPITITVGSTMGLKSRKTGVAKARKMTGPIRISPERVRRTPPTGKRVATART